jgi:hypothetical protein
MAEVWLAGLWHLFGKWLTAIANPDHCNCYSKGNVNVKSESVLLPVLIEQIRYVDNKDSACVLSCTHTGASVVIVVVFVCVFYIITIGVFQYMY